MNLRAVEVVGVPGIGKTALLPFIMAYFWSLDARFSFVIHLPHGFHYLSRYGNILRLLDLGC